MSAHTSSSTLDAPIHPTVVSSSWLRDGAHDCGGVSIPGDLLRRTIRAARALAGTTDAQLQAAHRSILARRRQTGRAGFTTASENGVARFIDAMRAALAARSGRVQMQFARNGSLLQCLNDTATAHIVLFAMHPTHGHPQIKVSGETYARRPLLLPTRFQGAQTEEALNVFGRDVFAAFHHQDVRNDTTRVWVERERTTLTRCALEFGLRRNAYRAVKVRRAPAQPNAATLWTNVHGTVATQRCTDGLPPCAMFVDAFPRGLFPESVLRVFYALNRARIVDVGAGTLRGEEWDDDYVRSGNSGDGGGGVPSREQDARFTDVVHAAFGAPVPARVAGSVSRRARSLLPETDRGHERRLELERSGMVTVANEVPGELLDAAFAELDGYMSYALFGCEGKSERVTVGADADAANAANRKAWNALGGTRDDVQAAYGGDGFLFYQSTVNDDGTRCRQRTGVCLKLSQQGFGPAINFYSGANHLLAQVVAARKVLAPIYGVNSHDVVVVPERWRVKPASSAGMPLHTDQAALPRSLVNELARPAPEAETVSLQRRLQTVTRELRELRQLRKAVAVADDGDDGEEEANVHDKKVVTSKRCRCTTVKERCEQQQSSSSVLRANGAKRQRRGARHIDTTASKEAFA